jgi:hypothetical protein
MHQRATEFSVNRFGGDTACASAVYGRAVYGRAVYGRAVYGRTVYAGAVPLTADDIAEAAAWVVGLPAGLAHPAGQRPTPLLMGHIVAPQYYPSELSVRFSPPARQTAAVYASILRTTRKRAWPLFIRS